MRKFRASAGEPAAEPGGSGTARSGVSRNKVLAGVVAAVVALAGIGWAVGADLRSPADQLASRRPPKPSLVTVLVERRKLTSTVTVNGTLTYGSPLPVTLAGTVGVTGATGGDGGTGGGGGTPQRVTKAPQTGPIREGDVLMQVNGRPVFVFRGRLPMYRPLVPGTEGDDVRQLQRALRRKGVRVPVSGVFDQATVTAVKRWYAKRGYQAQEPDMEARKNLQTYRETVRNRQAELAEARKALDEGLDVQPLKLRLDNARRDLRSAEQALRDALRQDMTPDQAAKLTSLRQAVRTAEEAVLAAEKDLNEAREQNNNTPPPPGTPPPSESPLPTPTPSRSTDTRLLEMKLANARQALYEARKAVDDYFDQVRDEQDKRLEELRKAVRTAKEAEATAKQSLRRAREVSPLRMKVSNSAAGLADARDMLAEFLKTYGVSLPAGEVVFLPTLPARVDKVEVKPGDTIQSKVATVTSSAFAITGSVEAKEAKLLRRNQSATMETLDGTLLPARLAATGEAARVTSQDNKKDEKQDTPDTGSVPILLTPDTAKGLKALVGSSLTVRISVGSTEGEVLSVPVAAVVTSADGRPRVRLALDGDRTREVEVRTGLTADGNVEITPVQAGAVKEGDRVVVSDA
ncbi:peptidoglycan-binding protein [Nonomuraea sediminis]|uniref:peptidoglycan-binding protein n=1 Tax=Nonomuraea sediminis TaxID=2835864 RepID=UPI001BDD27C6|nr:peptidoglycan-binding protein [Nonomuraea sediminis]